MACRAVVALVAVLLVSLALASAAGLSAKEQEIARRQAQALTQAAARGKRGACPNDCSNHGQCYGRECVCSNGWSGDDCSIGATGALFVSAPPSADRL